VSPDALVVGEALIDVVIGGAAAVRHPGGSPANVALGLARLGVATRLHTAVGDDADGRLIRAHLADSGVDVTAESVTADPTSAAVATLAGDGSATYEFSVRWNPGVLADVGAPRLVHTGSLAAFLEPGRSVTRDLVRRAQAAGALVSFDPNVRPDLVCDAAAARERFADLAAVSSITKMSDEDAGFLFPGEPIEDVLELLLASGAAVAAITRGRDGALLGSGDHRVEVPAASVAVADTVGAGDTFMAALLWALVFRDDGSGRPGTTRRLDEIGRIAVDAAAVTVSRAGADLPWVGELA
jgi:fructokinase